MSTTSAMQTAPETVKAICGWHELEGKNIGDRVTVTTYRPAQVGSGMDGDGELTGVLVGKSDEPTRCYGCSFAWREAEIRVDLEDARLHAAAVALGRKGGQATSEAKTEAARVNAKRGGRPRKQTDDFEYAVQIQPRNGQQLVEYREGLTLTYRDWNNADRKRHPQAERQLWDGACLVVDLDTDNVYAVEKP